MVAAGCGTPNDQSTFDPDTQNHIAGWVKSKHAPAAQGNIASCTECHGVDLLGGMSGVSCSTCHINGMTSLTGCTSCHGNPPTGIDAPNRRGAHTAHKALPSSANACSNCHNGAGSNTPNHYNGVVNTSMLSTFNSTSGAAVLNADGTCSNVSCHGGQATPGWQTGEIDLNTQCTSCHAYNSPEYNSFVSGQHDKHVNELQFECNRCHDTAKLAVSHFTSLNTPTMEGPASATLLSSLSYTGGTCTPVCHGQESW
jgi:predicted CxxxxCH...CXXCH cytochrome family protein